MTLIKEIFSSNLKTHAVIFFASVLFVLIFSTSTSPLYDSLGDDSAIFQAVGRGWAEGLLPYVDLFENKGPLIFLIDALGYMIRPRVGIFLLQIPAMYLSFLLAWRSLGIFLSGKVKIAAAIFMFMHYAIYTLDGNRTEEWSMPFLMAATYFFLRGLKEEKFSCPPLYGFIYGLGFGTCVLLRT
ncbi:MAG: glycosyltransferase family 39 protein, partial [Selenomonadaceae bacterium]|nr:glycosyltransferase family 39 protein [Selenomonadaceae bacterium]